MHNVLEGIAAGSNVLSPTSSVGMISMTWFSEFATINGYNFFGMILLPYLGEMYPFILNKSCNDSTDEKMLCT
ncbi:hypothetical protein DYBT9623_01434 [Dyadobacter sp. CECT 9623]|uniref:Na+/H+ antiporter NhaC-like C-terminal domain-containing protein n=1 Tax=Dyadobacter linearis TaxID=2823330 RepID=A0ABM8UML6_9BACT|nr:hypothetical protein DYBT9623_01434 [Dyadobacter sp. CECT 9623]